MLATYTFMTIRSKMALSISSHRSTYIPTTKTSDKNSPDSLQYVTLGYIHCYRPLYKGSQHSSYISVIFIKVAYRVNNNNNDKTSIAPISSNGIKLSGAPSTGVGQTHSLGMMQFINNDQMARKLRKDKRV